MELTISIPAKLSEKITIGNPYHNYNIHGKISSYGIDISFREIGLKKTLKSSNLNLLGCKVEEVIRNWEIKYQNYLDKEHKKNQFNSAEILTSKAQANLDLSHGILKHTINKNDTIDWDIIKRKDSFRIEPSQLFKDNSVPDFLVFNNYGRPVGFNQIELPIKPTFQQVKENPPSRPTYKEVSQKYSIFDRLFRKSVIKKDFDQKLLIEYNYELSRLTEIWTKEILRINAENKNREIQYQQACEKFDKKKKCFEEEKERDNKALEDIKERYKNFDLMAIEEYCDLVLDHSEYPDYINPEWNLEYRIDSRMVAIDYSLPNPDLLPKIESFKYIKTSGQIVEKHLTETAQKKLYDNVIYQICIRTIHELFEADLINALDSIAFNGLVTRDNPATGITETKTILSVLASKSEFNTFDLSKIDPKATFRHLKGISAASLIDITPIPPIIKLDKKDSRFIEGKEVAKNLNESVNVAAMDWQDFEFLIRELFEKEFASNGGEVMVTQASADGGVDAVAFDPDPIRGGKIIIQAKRYTNTVGVASVRDLYGTIMNEGAIKGLLVTTSDYGKDSYEFAKDKPITLLNGGNLLALLEKHGHQAYINVSEAKKILNS